MILFGSFPPPLYGTNRNQIFTICCLYGKNGKVLYFSICCFWERGFIFPFFYLGEGVSNVFFVLSFLLRVDEDEGGDGSDD